MWSKDTDIAIKPDYERLNNSYFIGLDPCYGSGNRSFFTYYSEFNRKYAVTPYVEATVIFLIFLFSTVANLTIMFLLIWKKNLRTVTNIFIGSLAMSDFLFTLTGPLIAICRIKQSWTFGHMACDVIVYAEFVCGSVSIWTMTMISVERYFCIVRSSTSTFTARVAVITIVVMWSVALLCYSSIIVSFRVVSLPFGSTTVTICTLVWPTWNSVEISWIFTAFMLILNFIMPLIILTHNYVRIFLKFRNVRRLVRQTQQTDPNWCAVRTNIQKLRNTRDLKVVKTVFSLVIIFTVMWFPIYGCFFYILVDNIYGTMKLGSYVFIIALCCAMGNACVNPILYGVKNERLKAVLISCLPCYGGASDVPLHILNRKVHPHSIHNGRYSIGPIREESEIKS